MDISTGVSKLLEPQVLRHATLVRTWILRLGDWARLCRRRLSISCSHTESGKRAGGRAEVRQLRGIITNLRSSSSRQNRKTKR